MGIFVVSVINGRNISGLGYGSGSDDEARNSAAEESDDESEDEQAFRERMKRKRVAFERKMKEMEEEGKHAKT